jgi:hypothetical protein
MTQHTSSPTKPAWTCTGVSWRGGHPALMMTNASGGELARPLRYGEPFGLEITGLRRCVGIWRGDVRSCPFDSPIAADRGPAQCSACAAADPGRALARNATIDPRQFRLYLATFGAGVLKVGITAVDRGAERLLEQGALAFTWLAQGSHPAIRVAEAAVAGAGMATERPRRSNKLVGWWHHGDATQRRDALLSVAEAAYRLPAWPTDVRPTAADIVDHADLYGVGDMPDSVDDVDQLAPSAVLVGRVRTVIGAEILLDHSGGSGPGTGLLVNGRILAGWPITPARTAGGGYSTRPIDHSNDLVTDAVQNTLF